MASFRRALRIPGRIPSPAQFAGASVECANDAAFDIQGTIVSDRRADNHQILQPMFVSTWSDNVKFDVEKTGLGFKTDVKLNAKDTALPTTCKMQRPA